MQVQQSTAKNSFAVPSDPVQRAWIALQRVAPAIQEKVEMRLKAAGYPDLAWYSVLWALERAGEPRRPRDLGLLLFLPRYKLSRLADRMEAEGLIERRACPEDARGHLLALTEKGRALRLAMWSAYAPAMGEVMRGITEDEALVLTRVVDRLGENINEADICTEGQASPDRCDGGCEPGCNDA
jgi:DNA-binding MarR family transcriptional regulator